MTPQQHHFVGLIVVAALATAGCDAPDLDLETAADTDALDETFDETEDGSGDELDEPAAADAADQLMPPEEVVFGHTIVDGPEGPVVVTYRDVGGIAVADGDVSLGPVDELPALDEEDLELLESGELELEDLDAEFAFTPIPFWGVPWPNGVIFYVDPQIDGGAFDQRIRTSMALMEIFTDVDFVAIPQVFSQFVDHLFFRASFYQNPGTARSSVGRQGGRQYITFSWFDAATGALPSTGLVQHELGHTVGMFHEHQRSDRDNFVVVVWPCIQAAAQSDFDKRVGLNLTPYDTSSIMHYTSTTFATGGGFCGSSLLSTTGATLGGNTLTANDITGLNWLAGF